MDITFSGDYAINPETFGINFEAMVDGEKVICSVSIEALQDINPQNSQDAAKQQFIENRSMFEAIAREKIQAGGKSPILIGDSDVRA